jgi:hypothetical protein
VPRIRFLGDWGATYPEVIEQLCTMAAEALVAPLTEAEARSMPQRIDVQHNWRGPWTLFDYDEDSVTIELSAYDNYWSQYLTSSRTSSGTSCATTTGPTMPRTGSAGCRRPAAAALPSTALSGWGGWR